LDRGYSITRDAENRALRSAENVQPGAIIETILAAGRLRSVVETSAENTEDEGIA
jgi:exonuclease VII large subunit